MGGASANKGWPSIENSYPADCRSTEFGETHWTDLIKEFRRNKTRAACVGVGVGGDVCKLRLQTKLLWPYTS